MQIQKLLELCVSHGASDLHLTVGAPPTLRIHGRMRNAGSRALTPDDTNQIMRAITSERAQAELTERGGADFGFRFGDPPKGRFRVSVFKQKGSIGLVLRLIPQQVIPLAKLGLPPQVKKICMRTRGLVLVTGPTGSGKTTTLASMIDAINRGADRHILTIEDPIEYEHEHQKSIVNQREVGVDVPDFPEALRRGLRQDPDVILLGEMRDLETMSTAITAAETGHLVFGTVHTVGAAETIHRVVDAFPPERQSQIRAQLSTALACVISQVLLPRADDGKGRVPAFEVLVVTSAIAHLIRENKIHRIDNEMQTGARLGMRLLDEDLLELFRQGKVKLSDALEKARDPIELQKRLKTEGRAASAQAPK